MVGAPSQSKDIKDAAPALKDVFSSIETFKNRIDQLAGQEKWTEIGDILRQSDEFLVKKIGEVEEFLFQLKAPMYGSVIVFLVNALYEVNVQKRSDQDTLRTLQILEHIVNEGLLQKEQIMPVVDVYTLLFRKAGEYLLRKQEFGMIEMFAKAINVLVEPQDYTITSLHPILFCHALKSGRFELAEQFVHPYVKAILNEHVSSSTLPPDPRALLLYFYYGGLLIGRSRDWNRAMVLFQAAFTLPANIASAIQIEAGKKLCLISLIVTGHFQLPNPRSSSVTRAWKTHAEVYGGLTTALDNVTKEGDRADVVRKELAKHYTAYLKDNNVGLMKLLADELRDKAVLRVAKLHSVVSLERLTKLAHLSSKEESLKVMADMVAAGRLSMSVEDGFVSLAIPRQIITQEAVDQRRDRMKELLAEVERLDHHAQMAPYLMAKQQGKQHPFFLGNDDEGLSNSPENAFIGI